jgi:hypothetical protein
MKIYDLQIVKNLRIFSISDCEKLLLGMSTAFVPFTMFVSMHVCLTSARTVGRILFVFSKEGFIHYSTVPLEYEHFR